MNPARIPPAELQWRGAQAYSAHFGDIYFSTDGSNEVRRVFLEPTGLSNPRSADDASLTTVAELGFGTGLNFAVLAERFLQASHARLHFISVEAHPLRFADWQTVAAQQPQLSLYAELAAFPPPLLRGWHRRTFAAGRITLSVFHGEVAEALSEIRTHSGVPVDAWLLDGFDPQKNPAMWQPQLFADIAAASRAGSRIATFTAAGQVRRNLEAVGFTMQRVDQRPYKRESLAGTLTIAQHQRPATSQTPVAASDLPVTIYGAGIAGAMVARHLADAGVASIVVDPHGIAGGASAMRHTLLHARLLGDLSAEAELRSHAFHYATAYARHWLAEPSGAYQVEGRNMDAAKLARIADAYGAQDPDNHHWIEYRHQYHHQAEDPELRLSEGDGCLWFPTSRVVDLAEWCRRLLDHPLICFSQSPPAQQHWRVLCTATATRKFANLDWLELADVGGQLDTLSFSQPRVQHPVIGQGYYLPIAGGAVIGSSYEYQPWTPAEATAHNIEKTQHLLPAEFQTTGYQRGNRSTTSDRVPLVGQVDEHTWLCTGMGSMGTTYAPLAAALVSSQLTGTLPPLTPALVELLDPQRIATRQAKRGPRHR